MSEMELLIHSLEERQRAEALEQIHKAATFLEPRNEFGCNCFVKQPEPYQVDTTYRYQHDPEDLLRAFSDIAERSERRMPPPVSNFQGIVGAEPYPVTKKAKQLLKRLVMRGVERFRSLFRGSRSRSEIVATFLAILELCRLRSIELDGDGDEMDVRFCKMPEEEMESLDG